MYHWPIPDGFPGQQPDNGGPTLEPDLRIAFEVVERLRAVRRLHGQRISVQVQNRVVILEGSVLTANQRILAAAHCWRTPGVFDVCNGLDVHNI
jgi:osmotically-inducible protein OsmY